jgi:hypothetical protein
VSAPAISPIPAGVVLGGQLLIDSAWDAARARCRAANAVCVAVEWRTARTHVVADEGTWQTLKGHCDFYLVSTITAERYLRSNR